MPKHPEAQPPLVQGGGQQEPTPFERFQALTQRLLHVPKHEVDEAVERDREKRRSA